MIATEENFINETFLVERATYNIQASEQLFKTERIQPPAKTFESFLQLYSICQDVHSVSHA